MSTTHVLVLLSVLLAAVVIGALAAALILVRRGLSPRPNAGDAGRCLAGRGGVTPASAGTGCEGDQRPVR